MSARVSRVVLAVAGAALACLGIAGCGLGDGLYNVTLPGGADLGSHPYTVTVQFADALDLVPQSAVKVDDVPVGRVSKIDIEVSNGKVADVAVEINGDVRLPANAVASIDQTSLLGEKYVSLAGPLTGAATGRLANGAVIPLARSTDGVEVESILGALSEVLNGGGIGQLQDITKSLNTVLDGHETQARNLIGGLSTIVGDLDDHKASITQALDALSTLSITLRRSDSQITNVLASLEPGIAELADQRKLLISTLTALNTLSTVTVDTLQQSKDQIVADLKSLAPVLDQLASAGTALPQSLQVLLTFPFPDSVLKAIAGDYVNAYVTTRYNTPGGTLVKPENFATTPAVRLRDQAVSAPTITPPPSLLPATSSAAAGLPSVLTTSAVTSVAMGGGR